MLAALLPLLALPAVSAHMTMWHPSMYGFTPEDLSYSKAAQPIPMGAPFDRWWFRGDINKPPEEGQFLELPAGGVFTGEISNHKMFTSYGKETPPDTNKMASDHNGFGLLHTHDIYGIPPEQTKEVMGCGLGIAYESDVNKVQPEDFTIISTNRYCPWYRDVNFQIPKGLPACPPGGCHCMWGWIHNERGGGQELYFTGYRCNVTGETGTVPIPKPAVARKCPYDKKNCTIGAKQPHYWLMGERNNNHQGYSDAPFYNEAYGFNNGAQNDLWDIDLGTTWNNNASDQAPIPSTYGKWDLPIIPRDPNAPVGKATGPGAVNSPDSNAAPATPSENSESSASTGPSGASSASTLGPSGDSSASTPGPSGASSASTPGPSGASSASTPGPAGASAASTEPSTAPGINADDNNLKVEPIGSNPTILEAGSPSAASSNPTNPEAGSPSAASSANGAVGTGASNSSAPATGKSADGGGSGKSTSPLPDSPPKPKKCKRSRKRFARSRL